MPLMPAVLILASCFTHASWNLLARHSRQELFFFRRMLIMVLPMAAAAIGVAALFPHSFPLTAWLCVIGSGILSGLYFRFLALAYGSADFTVVYPVARALPVIMVAGIDTLRGRFPSGAGWLAMLMVVGGCVLAPQRSYRRFDWRHYGSRSIMWIVLTACAIVGFTMLDKLAAETVRAGLPSAVIYCGLFHIFSCLTYVPLHAVFDRRLTPREGAGELGWAGPIAAGVLGLVSYTLVLWAFQMSTQTGYLVAFRQFSIVIGVVVAFRAYREPGLAVRLPATLGIVAGLVLIALFG